MARWLEVEYPAIAARKKEKAIVLWLDQTGPRSDTAVGTTWAPVGKTPVVGKTGKRSGVNVMAAVSNKGELYFTCYTGCHRPGVPGQSRPARPPPGPEDPPDL